MTTSRKARASKKRPLKWDPVLIASSDQPASLKIGDIIAQTDVGHVVGKALTDLKAGVLVKVVSPQTLAERAAKAWEAKKQDDIHQALLAKEREAAAALKETKAHHAFLKRLLGREDALTVIGTFNEVNGSCLICGRPFYVIRVTQEQARRSTVSVTGYASISGYSRVSHYTHPEPGLYLQPYGVQFGYGHIDTLASLGAYLEQVEGYERREVNHPVSVGPGDYDGCSSNDKPSLWSRLTTWLSNLLNYA